MKVFGSADAVVAAMREDLAEEIERFERQIELEMAAIREQASHERVDIADRDRRMAAARRDARERLAHEDGKDARGALERRERWIADVVAQARARLTAPETREVRHAWLAALAREALDALPPGDAVLAVPPDDHASLDAAWVSGVSGPRTVTLAAEPIAGGCIARSRDGRVTFDNTIDARLTRLTSTWRSVLGSLYESAVTAVAEPRA